VKLEEEHPKTPQERRRQRQIYTLLIVAFLAAVAAGLLLASSVWTGWKAPKESSSATSVDAGTIDPEKTCATQATYDGIKKELFRRAGQTRGGDPGPLMRIADFSLLRIEGPYLRGFDDQTKRTACSGVAVLQLPPQVTTAEGMGTLTSNVDYDVQPAADGTGNVVTIGNADAITVPLATLRGNAPVGPPPQLQPVAPPDSTANADELAPLPEQTPQPQQAQAQPAFDCSRARTSGEQAVCGNASLAALDRQMSGQFDSAMNNADDEQRALLRSTRSRFLAYRDRCGSDSCIADAYRGRIREIRDIMSGDWRGQQ
jgi:uncharacterized protein YecT (DUF1311 family)